MQAGSWGRGGGGGGGWGGDEMGQIEPGGRGMWGVGTNLCVLVGAEELVSLGLVVVDELERQHAPQLRHNLLG